MHTFRKTKLCFFVISIGKGSSAINKSFLKTSKNQKLWMLTLICILSERKSIGKNLSGFTLNPTSHHTNLSHKKAKSQESNRKGNESQNLLLEFYEIPKHAVAMAF